MSWLITGAQPFPAVIGEEFGGGYFAGYISHTADGNPTHALIVAPRATGATGTGYPLLTAGVATNYAQILAGQSVPSGSGSSFNGKDNTDAMIAASSVNFPAAKFCDDLSIGGFTDWYLPAYHEFNIAYNNLKPGTGANLTNTPASNLNSGINPYSVPRRDSGHTSTIPAQTYVMLFQSGNAQAFEAQIHWSSTNGWLSLWQNGLTYQDSSALQYRVRAFRRIAL
jgi:hypothetical protein